MTQELETKDGSAASAHPADAQGKPAVSGHQGKPKQHDKVTRMGTESIPRLITEFAVPSILGMLVNGAYNVVDSIFLGQAMGKIGLSTATVAMPISLQARMIRTAISPRLAIRIFENILRAP